MQITPDLFSNFVSCRYKAYLKQNGNTGHRTEYESVHDKLNLNYLQRALEHLAQKYRPEEVVTGPESLLDACWTRHRLILGATYITATRSFTFSAVEHFHNTAGKKEKELIPITFSQKTKLSKHEKLLAAFAGTVLSEAQSLPVRLAEVIHGPTWSVTKVRFEGTKGPTQLMQETRRLLNDLESMSDDGASAPELLLNRHCNICEFWNQCQEEASQRDDLSLLAGLRPKEIGNNLVKEVRAPIIDCRARKYCTGSPSRNVLYHGLWPSEKHESLNARMRISGR